MIGTLVGGDHLIDNGPELLAFLMVNERRFWHEPLCTRFLELAREEAKLRLSTVGCRPCVLSGDNVASSS